MGELYSFDIMDGIAFERWCAQLLTQAGYTKVKLTPGSGDHGVDIVAEKNGVKYAIQCKCYTSNVGNSAIQQVYAGKAMYKCHVGVVMTNSFFTHGAQELAQSTDILLWDRDKIITIAKQSGGKNLLERISLPQRNPSANLQLIRKAETSENAFYQKKKCADCGTTMSTIYQHCYRCGSNAFIKYDSNDKKSECSISSGILPQKRNISSKIIALIGAIVLLATILIVLQGIGAPSFFYFLTFYILGAFFLVGYIGGKSPQLTAPVLLIEIIVLIMIIGQYK